MMIRQVQFEPKNLDQVEPRVMAHDIYLPARIL